MSIPTISAEASVPANESGEDALLEEDQQSAQVSQTVTGSSSNVAITADNDKTAIATGDKTAQTKQPAISVQKMNEIKNQVTAPEKVTAAVMVMSKLSTAEINQLKSLLAGGLTAEEKAKAKSIAFANFSSKEIEEIKDMYTKYMNK